ncbi:MAG TPA: hypothetical protein VJ110_00190 [Candidatus Nanoarchaeia archaeon]|nr:hypothetical protein [Candidatus Nanoarchaeia archaeon]
MKIIQTKAKDGLELPILRLERTIYAEPRAIATRIGGSPIPLEKLAKGYYKIPIIPKPLQWLDLVTVTACTSHVLEEPLFYAAAVSELKHADFYPEHSPELMAPNCVDPLGENSGAKFHHYLADCTVQAGTLELITKYEEIPKLRGAREEHKEVLSEILKLLKENYSPSDKLTYFPHAVVSRTAVFRAEYEWLAQKQIREETSGYIR